MRRSLLFAAIFVPVTFAQAPLDCSSARYCEMREETVSSTGRFSVEDLHNGSITVRGSNRTDVLVRMRVENQAHSDGEARDVFGRIHTHVTPGRFTVDGPSQNNPIDWFFGTGWSVSVEVLVPNKTDLRLASHNGPIRVTDVDGRVRAQSHNGAIRMDQVGGDVDFESHNGGVTLKGIGGSIQGNSHNGAIEADLTGSSAAGRRIVLESWNGAVTLALPRGYNAHVTSDTHNGRLNSDFPITVRGQIQRNGNDGHREFDLGSGGSTIRLSTHNGGIRLRQI